eukprot:gene1825-1855_t
MTEVTEMNAGAEFVASWQANAERLSDTYKPSMEHDNCGVGLVAALDGRRRRDVVEAGINALKAVWHRGAVDADGKTGDGAGIHVEIPQDFFLEAVERGGHRVRKVADGGSPIGVGQVFLPKTDLGAQERCRQIVETEILAMGYAIYGWRQVPINVACIGEKANATRPEIEQIMIANPRDVAEAEFERDLFVIRRRIEKQTRLSDPALDPFMDDIKPVIQAGGSDTAVLDNVFEVLIRSGRDAPMAKALMIPASIGADATMKKPHRDLEIVEKGRVGPGQSIGVDLDAAKFFSDDAMKDMLSARQPFGEWARGIIEIDKIVRTDAPEPTRLGNLGNVLDEDRTQCDLLQLESPVLSNAEFAAMRAMMGTAACEVDCTFPVEDGETGLRAALERIRIEAEEGVRAGATHVILSDERVSAERAGIPMILATAGVHTHLVRSRISGIGLLGIARKVLTLHNAAWDSDAIALPVGGVYKLRRKGETHAFDGNAIHMLQEAVASDSFQMYRRYTEIVRKSPPIARGSEFLDDLDLNPLLVQADPGPHARYCTTEGRNEVPETLDAQMIQDAAALFEHDGEFHLRANADTITWQRVAHPHWAEMLRGLVATHAEETNSRYARMLVHDWDLSLPKFWQIVPKEFVKYLPVPLTDVPEALRA